MKDTHTPTSTFEWIRRAATSNLAFPVVALVSSPLLAHALGADGRGALAATTIPFLIVINSVTLGLPESLTYSVARRSISSSQLMHLAIVIPVVVGSSAALVAWFVVPSVLHRYPEYTLLACLLFLLLPPALVLQNVRGAALGVGEFRAVFRERYVATFSRLLLLVVVFAWGALTVRTAAVLTITTGVLSGVVLITAYLRARARLRDAAPATSLFVPVQYGTLVWVGAIAQFLTLRMDQLVLATMIPAAALGAYAVAVSLAEVSNGLTSAVKEVVFSQASERQSQETIRRGCRLAVTASTVFAVGASIVTEFALVPVFGEEFKPAIHLTQVLLLASIGSGVGNVVGVGFAVFGQPGRWSTVQFGGLVVTLGLLVPVVRWYGANGAAWLSVFSYWGIAALGVVWLALITKSSFAAFVFPSKSDLLMLGDIIKKKRAR